MKIITLFLFFPFWIYAQEFKIIGLNINGQTDTLTIGYRANATLGVDNQFNEVNIFGQPVTKTVDIRIVQRDSANFSCSYFDWNDNRQIIYPTNFDSKINWRNRNDTSLMNRSFEIKCLTPNIRSLRILHNFGFQDITFFDRIVDSENGCGQQDSFRAYFAETNFFQFSTMINSSFSNFVIVLKKGLLLDTPSPTKAISVKTYPNPFDTQLTIEVPEKQNISEIRIFDILGRMVFYKKTDSLASITLDLAHLKKGSYYLTLYDSRNMPLRSQVIIK